jgi:hypothetical protein
MHFGKKNNKYTYRLQDSDTLVHHDLAVTSSEKDLGVIITSDAKWTTQAASCASKANSILGWMKSAFTSRDASLWKKLYTTYIRPHLEFAVPAWNVYQTKDVERIEQIQRRAT